MLANLTLLLAAINCKYMGTEYKVLFIKNIRPLSETKLPEKLGIIQLDRSHATNIGTYTTKMKSGHGSPPGSAFTALTDR